MIGIDGDAAMVERARDAGLYDRSFGFVSAFATDMVDLLAPEPGERIVDLGCGTGTLTAAIAARGADVIGIDGDAAMVERARALHPAHSPSSTLDGRFDFAIEGQADAVFSNAALHWMKEAPARGHRLAVAQAVARSELPAGASSPRWARTATCASSPTRSSRRSPRKACRPSRGRLPLVLPAHEPLRRPAGGRRLRRDAVHYFARPTPLDDCPNGLADWIVLCSAVNFTDAAPPGRAQAVAERTVACSPASASAWTAAGSRTTHARFVAKPRRRIVANESDRPARMPATDAGIRSLSARSSARV